MAFLCGTLILFKTCANTPDQSLKNSSKKGQINEEDHGKNNVEVVEMMVIDKKIAISAENNSPINTSSWNVHNWLKANKIVGSEQS